MPLACAQMMDSLVFQDSPLATYLEGAGERDQDWTAVEADQTQTSDAPSFAPQGLSTLRARLRNRFAHPSTLQVPEYRGPLSRLQDVYSSAVSSRIGRSEGTRFLEQFRYPIVASQLLNDHTTHALPQARAGPFAGTGELDSPYNSPSASYSLQGAFFTAALAFLIVWLVHGAKAADGSLLSSPKFWIASAMIATVAIFLYIHAKHRRLAYLRHQAIDAVTALVSTAQAFDSAGYAALTLIQEVELVSRGYSISSPLPPISRLEEGSQVRYCSRLRRNLSKSLKEIISRCLAAHCTLQPLVEHADLERYYDIYEISRSELQEMSSGELEVDLEKAESLKSLKTLLARLHSARKIILCNLLALEANGGLSENARWSAVVFQVQALASVTGTCSQGLTTILGEDDNLGIVDCSSKSHLATSDQHVKAQLRRLNSLSQGIRALHAKIHVLREESDATTQRPEELSLSNILASQYDSIGADLRGLLQEWEVGKASLSLSVERPTRFSSHSSNGLRSPMSPTFSLGGQTAVGGSPSDALRILNGEDFLQSKFDISDEEIFEAIALPRKRSSTTREERIAKMKEDRVRQSLARDKADANTHMLKELETVIKLRPHGRTTSRVTSA